MKTIFFLICFAVSLSAIAGAGEMQTGVLKNLRGASKDLDFKLNCLRNKSYPDDIEKCGLSGFGTLAHEKDIENCLSTKAGLLHPLEVKPSGEYITVLMTVQCAKIWVAVLFKARSQKYSVVEIGELLD